MMCHCNEIEELRAEVERLKRDVAGQTRSAQNGWRHADERRVKLAKIETLADEWAHNGSGYGVPNPSWGFVERQLREVLDA